MVYTLKIKELHFDATHYLTKKFGRCYNLHGHTYTIQDLTLITESIVNFEKIKQVLDNIDHSTIVPVKDVPIWKELVRRNPELPFNIKLYAIPKETSTVEYLAECLQKEFESIEGVLSVKFELYEGKNQGVMQ